MELPQVFRDRSRHLSAPQHRPEQHEIADGMLGQQVERQQWVTKVVQHAMKARCRTLAELVDLAYGHLTELNVDAGDLRREGRLSEVSRIGVDAQDARRAALLQLDG